ncbi:MAG: hypothetical protein ACTSXU_13850 [Promethearchaeota archaeon]
MDSTVVGSFPLSNTPENFHRAFVDQINAGITIPCYPQLIDMNYQILKPLSDLIDGLEYKDKEFHLSASFKTPVHPVALNYGEETLKILRDEPELVKRIKGKKACFTGPFTLCSNIIIDNEEMTQGHKPLLYREIRGHVLPEILEEMAEHIALITRAYKEMGFDIISIDDPFLGQLIGRKKILFHEEDFIIETINKAARYINKEGSIHVCGTISGKLRDILLKTNIKYLDHEFKTNPRNIELYDRKMLEEHDKVLAFGAIKTNPVPIPGREIDSYVEDLQEIINDLELAKKKFGQENLLIKPDCGFGGMNAFDRIEDGLGYKLAIRKLKIMNEAKNRVFD